MAAWDVLTRLKELNAQLRDEGERARVRYVAVEPDPDFEGRRLVLVIWELPKPGADAWPLADLDKYYVLTVKNVGEEAVTVECLFRTRDELAEAAKMGTEVPAVA